MSKTLNTKVCPKCGAPLSFTSSGEGYCAFTDCLWNTNDFCSPLGHQDLGASLAAPAPVDQVGGTSYPCVLLTVLAFVSPCGNWRRVDDRNEYAISPLWGVINTMQERRA